MTEELTQEEILMLKDMAAWWRTFRTVQFQDWIKKEKDTEKRDIMKQSLLKLQTMKLAY